MGIFGEFHNYIINVMENQGTFRTRPDGKKEEVYLLEDGRELVAFDTGTRDDRGNIYRYWLNGEEITLSEFENYRKKVKK